MVGLIKSERVSLTAWIPYVLSRAKYAQSVQRRFQRWLHNSRIQVHHLYAPLIQEALADWGEYKLYLALDTSMLWNQYCVIRIFVIYRGRAVPVGQSRSGSGMGIVYQVILEWTPRSRTSKSISATSQ